MRRLRCLFRGHRWRTEEDLSTQGRSKSVFGVGPAGPHFLVTPSTDRVFRLAATTPTPAAVRGSSCRGECH
jgi:hypothetical protein